MKHPYSSILIAIAEGKEIQYRYCSANWYDIDHVRLLKHLAYDGQNKPAYLFRIKPSTININGVEVEGPVANGSYSLSIWPGMGERMNCHFTTPEARDAAYAALIKPFGEQA